MVLRPHSEIRFGQVYRPQVPVGLRLYWISQFGSCISSSFESGARLLGRISMTDDIDAVSSRILEAALDPSRWRSVLEEARVYTDSSEMHLLVIDPSSLEIIENTVLFSHEAQEEFPEVAQYAESLMHIIGSPDWSIFTDNDYITPEEIEKSTFYNWADQYDGKYRAVLRLCRHKNFEATLTFLRSGKQGHTDDKTLEKINSLAPHLRMAAHIRQALTGSTVHLERLVESFEAARTGAVILEGSGGIAFANAPAQAVFKAGDGVSGSSQGIVLSDGDAMSRLSRLVSDAARASLTKDFQRPGGRLFVKRPSGLPPYQLLISGLPPTDPLLDPRKSWVLALIVDPRDAASPSAELLQETYNLTEAEAAVAHHFSNGLPLEQIAEVRAVSTGTVRNQIKSLMAKMGVERQVDLMRLLSLMGRP